MKANIFIKKELIDINVYVVSKVEDGEIIYVSTSPYSSDVGKDGLFQVDKLEFKFQLPAYDEMNKYRQISFFYDKPSDTTVINPLRLRELLLMYQLKGWNLKDNEEKDIVIGFDADGSLDLKSMGLIKSMDVTIVDVLMTTFEQKLNM